MADLYQRFFRQCVRNLAYGILLSIIPAGAFYWFIFEHSRRQILILGGLGAVDLAAFFPIDLLVLAWSMRPVRTALSDTATREQKLAGLKRLLDSPLAVIGRVYLVHAPLATIGITLLVMLANRFMDLGIDPSTFKYYWGVNLSMIPIAHMVYEFAAMERATQEPASVLAKEVPVSEAGALHFTLHNRMRFFFPVLAVAPVVVMIVAIRIHNGNMDEETEHLIWDLTQIGLGCAALFLYLMWTLGGGLRYQTGLLTNVLRRLGKGELDARAELYTTSEFGELAQQVNQMAEDLNERERLRELFGAYMTPEVAHTLLARGASLEGRTERRFCAIVFVDIRGFTRFSSEQHPDVVLQVLNRLLTVTADAITESGGTVNKYLGDGLLAIYGAPQPLTNPCESAIKGSIEILHRVEGLNGELANEGMAPMKVGIGVHAGEVVVGTIGSARHKLEYTVIGDPVNVASRIEQLTKKVGVPLLVSHEVIEAAGGDWACHAGEPVAEAVRGLDREVVLFPIVIDANAAASSD